mmetsp:Transcript_28603/g.37466  ORF Transcript_28603/g.37466 Transcript_28603/m.37466 type:complete len:209 (-) Transcript_28603:35-661(-)
MSSEKLNLEMIISGHLVGLIQKTNSNHLPSYSKMRNAQAPKFFLYQPPSSVTFSKNLMMKICLNREQKEIKTSPEQRAQCLKKQQPQGLFCDHEFSKTQFGNHNFWTPCCSHIKTKTTTFHPTIKMRKAQAPKFFLYHPPSFAILKNLMAKICLTGRLSQEIGIILLVHTLVFLFLSVNVPCNCQNLLASALVFQSIIIFLDISLCTS